MGRSSCRERTLMSLTRSKDSTKRSVTVSWISGTSRCSTRCQRELQTWVLRTYQADCCPRRRPSTWPALPTTVLRSSTWCHKIIHRATQCLTYVLGSTWLLKIRIGPLCTSNCRSYQVEIKKRWLNPRGAPASLTRLKPALARSRSRTMTCHWRGAQVQDCKIKSSIRNPSKEVSRPWGLAIAAIALNHVVMI